MLFSLFNLRCGVFFGGEVAIALAAQRRFVFANAVPKSLQEDLHGRAGHGCSNFEQGG